jgi:2-dehydropantoate 2-reductase
MRYIIYGAGAIGGVIGGRLFQAGHDVVLIARGAHLDAIRERGLTLETPAETVMLPIGAVAHPPEITFTEDDVVLLTMKTQDTEPALDELRAAAGEHVRVICAQNGVENERLALRRFSRVYAMLVILPATHLEPGVVIAHAAPVSGILDAGRYPSGVDDTIERVASDISACGFSMNAVAEPMRLKYAKLLGNLGNALQAACGFDGNIGALYARLRDEAVDCYRAAGIEWTSDEEMNERRRAMSRPSETVGGTRRAGGSSWQSIARGAGSIETDYLNGEITLLGRLYGVPTPANEAMQRIAARMVREGMAPGSIGVEEIERQIAHLART